MRFAFIPAVLIVCLMLCPAAKAENETEELEAQIRTSKQSLLKNPDDPDVLLDMGVDLDRLARLTKKPEERLTLAREAEAAFARAVEIAPEDAFAWNGLGQVRLELAGRLPWEESRPMYAAAMHAADEALRVHAHVRKSPCPDVWEWRAWGTRGEALAQLAYMESGPEKIRLLKKACASFRRSTSFPSHNYYPVRDWGDALNAWADEENRPEDRRWLYTLAGNKLRRAASMEQGDPWLLASWSDALSGAAAFAPRREREAMYMQAAQKAEDAVNMQSDINGFWTSWGIALSRQAGLKDTLAERLNLRFAALEKHREALRLYPDNSQNHINVAYLLYVLAIDLPEARKVGIRMQMADLTRTIEEKQPEDADALLALGVLRYFLARIEDRSARRPLFERALVALDAAARNKEPDAELLSWQGWVLQDLGELAAGPEQNELFKRAEQKFADMSRRNPYDAKALASWGEVLIQRAAARREAGDEAGARACLAQARSKLHAGYALNHGEKDYHLEASIAALEGRRQACRRALEEAWKRDQTPGWEGVLHDAPFASVRNEPWFKAFSAPEAP